MGRKVKELDTRTPKEIRQDVISYNRKTRDTILIKWMALEEAVRSEDNRREQFYRRREREDTKHLPINVQRFIGTLKRAVRRQMTNKGGTAYSIIRNMFLYWDADKSGEVSSKELRDVMNQLGARVTDEQLEEIVLHYDSGKGTNEMTYLELLQDLTIGEPTITEFGDFRAKGLVDDEPRFEEVVEEDAPMPKTVELFLEAVRDWVLRRMQIDGGTPHHHVRFLFNFYDYDYSAGLNRQELMTAARKGMNLAMTPAQADVIIGYYDRWTREGQMKYDEFLRDVTIDVKPVLYYTEATPEERQQKIRSLSVNPFRRKPFKCPPTKVVEDFKKNVTVALLHKMNHVGGTVATWLNEAFTKWDHQLSRKISDVYILQGAAKMLHVTLSEEEARAIMHAYDKWGTGEMHYLELIKDINKEEGNVLATVDDAHQMKTALENSSTARCPAFLQKIIAAFRTSSEAYARKSGGVLEARDLLHGTFLRFDTTRAGKLDAATFSAAAAEVRVPLQPSEIKHLMQWFDTDGSQKLDYNSLVRQMFGEDVLTKPLALPKLNRFAGNSNYNVTNTYSAAQPTQLFDNSSTLVPQTKVMLLAESALVRKLRLDVKRKVVLTERHKVQERLKQVEDQRIKLLADYRLRQSAKTR